MQILVEIDDKLYNRIKYLEPRANTMLDELMRSIQNSVPLPKGHGRLIDADAVLVEPFGNTYKDIDTAETIIEADRSDT